MSDWTDGYVTDIQYTAGFYRELSPTYLEFLAAVYGYRWSMPERGGTYCELGSGQGYGTAILAASHPNAHFWGFDFNPAQTANARQLAADARLSNVTFDETSFIDLANAPDDALPMFDAIVLHGIYSWVSAENRDAIVQFIRRKLKPGGLVYNSYNCLPGWAAVGPLQKLFREHADRNPARSDVQFDAAFQYIDKLREAGAGYFVQNPQIPARMEKMGKGMERNYLAHEYLNEAWFSHYHVDVVREFEAAKLSFVFSATISENNPAFCVPPSMQEIVRNASDAGMRETLKDFAINKQFRRDVFLRGATPLSAGEALDRLRRFKFAALIAPAQFTPKFTIAIGEANGDPAVYNPIIELLATGPKSFNELLALPGFQGKPVTVLTQALQMLVHAQQVHPVAMDGKSKAGDPARALNAQILRRALYGDTLKYLAIPTTGSGQPAGYVDRLVAAVIANNPKITQEQMVIDIWDIMSNSGVRLMKDGANLETWEATKPELTEQVAAFVSERLPIWRQLGVI